MLKDFDQIDFQVEFERNIYENHLFITIIKLNFCTIYINLSGFMNISWIVESFKTMETFFLTFYCIGMLFRFFLNNYKSAHIIDFVYFNDFHTINRSKKCRQNTTIHDEKICEFKNLNFRLIVSAFIYYSAIYIHTKTILSFRKSSHLPIMFIVRNFIQLDLHIDRDYSVPNFFCLQVFEECWIWSFWSFWSF